MGLFFIIFHTIYFLMNLYVFHRLFGFFSINRPLVFWPLVIGFTFSLSAAMMAYNRLGPAFYPVYYLVTMWFGVLWLLFCCLLVCEPLRFLLRGVNPAHTGTAIIAIVGLATIYAAIHAQHPRVITYRIPAPVNLRLIQISDLHMGSVTSAYAQKVVDAVNSLHPDAVLATGDMIDSSSPNSMSMRGLERFCRLNAPAFCVTGNHENYAGLEKSVAALKSAGFTVLRGSTVDFKGIRLIGFDDDPRPAALAEDMAAMTLDPSAFNVLLFHHPDGFPAAASAGVQLMLAGHTHHGQIFPFSLLVRLHYKYPFGLYHMGNSTLYTTQGAGTWGPRMRLGTTAEIVVFELYRPDRKQ
jgi:predicted MPP superfamily phosphohydrolase